MLDNIKADLRRYVRSREDCSSVIEYLAQLILVILFHEGAICMIGYRIGAWFSRRGLVQVAYVISKIFFFITGNYIHHCTKIAPGCKLNHSCVVIHAESIGRGFECSANVTVGQKVPYRSPFPIIGDFVVVGAGARVLSDVGDEVIIGANSVVIDQVEGGWTVAGIPARKISSSADYMQYYKRLFWGKYEGIK